MWAVNEDFVVVCLFVLKNLNSSPFSKLQILKTGGIVSVEN